MVEVKSEGDNKYYKRFDCENVCVIINKLGTCTYKCEHCHVDNSGIIAELPCDLDEC